MPEPVRVRLFRAAVVVVMSEFCRANLAQAMVNTLFGSSTVVSAIGLNADLRMPQWRFKSGAPPSAFAYPPPTSNEKKEVAVATTKMVEDARESYRPIGTRGALVYFLIDQLSVIDHMYPAYRG